MVFLERWSQYDTVSLQGIFEAAFRMFNTEFTVFNIETSVWKLIVSMFIFLLFFRILSYIAR